MKVSKMISIFNRWFSGSMLIFQAVDTKHLIQLFISQILWFEPWLWIIHDSVWQSSLHDGSRCRENHKGKVTIFFHGIAVLFLASKFMLSFPLVVGSRRKYICSWAKFGWCVHRSEKKRFSAEIAGKRIATKDMIFFSTPIWNQPMRFLNEQTSVGGLNHIGWREVMGGKVVVGMLQLLGRRTGIYTSGQIITTNDLSRGHHKCWFSKGIPPKSP